MLLRYGFPINFWGDTECLMSDRAAHPSALEYPTHVEQYLNEECNMVAIYGPVTGPPFGKSTHTSTFITRSKAGSHKRCVIIDLSWPLGASVNHFSPETEYLGTFYKLKLPTVDDFVERLVHLGKGCMMYKIDLARAFRQLPVDPCDYPLLCLQWENQYYN